MAEDFSGKLIDRKYRLLSELGHGAMGVVYRAEQLDAEGRARRIVAVKTLKPEFSKDPDFARRFLREVGVSMQLRNPHVLTVYDSGRDESGQLYYVMEFMPQTLKEYLQEHGQIPIEHAVAIVSQICEALAEAHSLPEPVIHRDIKPANIFIEQRRGREVVKVGDFGIAKVLDEHTTVLTHAGQASPGTPRYMAPEQWLGQAIDGRTDLYSVGILLYEMVTGQPPFSGPIPVLMGQHLQLSPPSLPEEMPVGIRREVERLLAKKREDRPADAWSVRGALEAGLKNVEEQPTMMLPREETPSVKVDAVKDEVTGRQAKQKQEPLEQIPGPFGSKNIQDQPDVNEGHVRLSRRSFPWRTVLSLFAVVGVIGGLFLFLPQYGERPQLKEEPKAVALQPKEESKTVAVQPPTPQATPAPQVTDSQKVQSSVDDNMVLVPAGEFFMGCNEKVDNQCVRSDKPGRKVFLDAFKIDKTEVTVAAYGQCVKAGKCSAPDTRERCNWQQAGKENHPINCVDWNQAVAFCQWDKNKRLPTEAEWEKAARGTDGRVYPWGNEWDVKKANVDGKADGFEYTAPVGSFTEGVSPYGNFDMGGNVGEWTQDWYDKNYYQDGPTENPRGAEKGDDKVTRGGSWFDVAWVVRASNRVRLVPSERSMNVGVRCAR